jgi:hypothetical protein
MPQFYLRLRGSSNDIPNDPDPMEFPNIEAARSEAVRGIREIASELVTVGSRPNYEAIDIADMGGKVLMSVQFSDVLLNDPPRP